MPTMGLAQPRNVNLPKLDRIIVRNSGNHKPVGIYHNNPSYHERSNERKQQNQMNIDVSNLLKIQGKSNNARYDLSDPKKAIDRDLKAELRKIYNLKPSPSKQDRIKPLRRNVELPRIN